MKAINIFSFVVCLLIVISVVWYYFFAMPLMDAKAINGMQPGNNVTPIQPNP